MPCYINQEALIVPYTSINLHIALKEPKTRDETENKILFGSAQQITWTCL